MHIQFRHSPLREGFTVVELLVSMTIIGLLLSLLLPAVQRVRETSRNADCKNRLHQIGLAMHEHEAVHRVFPTRDGVCNRIMDAVGNKHSFFKCPSDHRSDEHGVSYLVNDGTDIYNAASFLNGIGNGFSASRFMARPGDPDIRASEIVDGLSQTAAVSERLLSSGNDALLSQADLEGEPHRYPWHVTAMNNLSTSTEVTNACRNNRTTPYPIEWTFPATNQDIGYDHFLGPNEYGCYLGAMIVPASSEHPGLVNVLMGDGSARPVSDHVDLGVWKAIGTRNGNETVGEF